MNIAILGIKKLPAFAGADRVVERLLQHYPSVHQFTVYLLKDPDTKPPELSPHIRYVLLPAPRGKHLRPFVFFLLCALHCLWIGRYDVAHVHHSDLGLFCLLLRLKPGLKIVGTFHGDPYTLKKWGGFARTYLRLSERLLVRCCHVLTSVAKSKIRALPPAAVRKFHHVPNGMELLPLDAQGAPFDFTAQGLKPGEYILFACGRLESIKGLHHLLDAYIDGHFAEKLLVVGDFSHDARYSSRMLEACRQSPMTVVKQELLSMAVLAEVIRKCKAFVFPSEQEAMSMMLLEVISCRRPVVCSDIAENLDVVGRDYPYLFRSGDSGDLRRVLRLALSEARAGAVAEALLSKCALRFDWRVIAGTYVSLYERVGTPSGRFRWFPLRSLTR